MSNMKNIGLCKCSFGLVLMGFEFGKDCWTHSSRDGVFEESHSLFFLSLHLPILGLYLRCAEGGFVLLQLVAGCVRCIDLS